MVDHRENYILPMDHPISIENIRRNCNKVKKIDNLFDSSELDHIWKQCFSDKRIVRMNRNGTIIVSGLLNEIYYQYKSKIDLLMEEKASLSPIIGGNYFITPQQYGLHNDSIRPYDFNHSLKKIPLKSENRKYTCWRNFLLPLWIGTHLDIVDGGQIAFFDQRHIDWAHVYNGGNKVPGISSIYTILSDYADIQFYDSSGNKISKEKNLIDFDVETYKKFMNTPYERLKGLTTEEIINWIPGTPIAFDAVQLHNSNEGSKEHGKKMWNSKMGLLLTFLIELDSDLLIDWRKEQSKM